MKTAAVIAEETSTTTEAQTTSTAILTTTSISYPSLEKKYYFDSESSDYIPDSSESDYYLTFKYTTETTTSETTTTYQATTTTSEQKIGPIEIQLKKSASWSTNKFEAEVLEIMRITQSICEKCDLQLTTPEEVMHLLIWEIAEDLLREIKYNLNRFYDNIMFVELGKDLPEDYLIRINTHVGTSAATSKDELFYAATDVFEKMEDISNVKIVNELDAGKSKTFGLELSLLVDLNNFDEDVILKKVVRLIESLEQFEAVVKTSEVDYSPTIDYDYFEQKQDLSVSQSEPRHFNTFRYEI